MNKLYALNKDSSIQVWYGEITGDDNFTVYWGKEGGKIQSKTTYCTPKNVGRSNETTHQQQTYFELESAYADQKRKGYVEDKSLLKVDTTSVMLACDALKKPKAIKYPCHGSPKLDGCFSYNTKITTNLGLLPIGYVVENKIKCNVLSFNHATNLLEWKPIVNWFNNGEKGSDSWVQIGEDSFITKNHKIFDGKDYVSYEKALSCYKQNHKYNGIICGMLLGDSVAAFEKRRKEFHKAPLWRLTYSVSDSDIEFGNKKAELLTEVVYSVYKRRSGYDKPVTCFTSNSLSKSPFPVEVFYNIEVDSENYGRRVVDIDYPSLFKIFTDESLSIWFFDDGSINYNNKNKLTPRIFLCVSRYSDSTIKSFVRLFEEKYNTKPTVGIYSKGKDKRLSFSTKDTFKLLDVICKTLGNLCPRKIPEYLDYNQSIKRENSFVATNLPSQQKPASFTGSIAYDIEVKDNHNYLADGMLVHNCRLLTIFENDEPVFISRGNKRYPVHKHLREQLIYLREQTGIDCFDGELYIWGMPLQKITSLAKKVQEGSENLTYQIFDIPSDKVWCNSLSDNGYTKTYGDSRYTDLYHNVDYIVVNHADVLTHIGVVDVTIINNEQEAKEHIGKFMEQGYEGLIIRNFAGKYEYGQRSNDLIKWKLFQDVEAKVIGCDNDKNNEGVLQCILQNGVTFKAKMKGTHEERLYENQLNNVGKFVNIKFQQYTIDGVPQFPVITGFREVDEKTWEPLE